MAEFFVKRIKEGPTSWEILDASRGREQGRRVVFYTEDNTPLCVEVVETTRTRDHVIHIRAKEIRKILGLEDLTIRYDTRRMRGNVSPFIP